MAHLCGVVVAPCQEILALHLLTVVTKAVTLRCELFVLSCYRLIVLEWSDDATEFWGRGRMASLSGFSIRTKSESSSSACFWSGGCTTAWIGMGIFAARFRETLAFVKRFLNLLIFFLHSSGRVVVRSLSLKLDDVILGRRSENIVSLRIEKVYNLPIDPSAFEINWRIEPYTVQFIKRYFPFLIGFSLQLALRNMPQRLLFLFFI